MSIPRIDPYELPTADALPAARVSWQIDPARAVLLIHDMQNHFVNFFTRDADPIRNALANMCELRARCHAARIPVVITMQPPAQPREARGLQADFWGPGMPDEPGRSDIVAELTPADNDIVLLKTRYSAFQRTDLRVRLNSLRRDQLIVTGVYAHIGCLLTAAEAFMQDVQPFYVADAVADFSREHHDMAVKYVAGHCAVPITTQQVMAAL